MDMPRCLLFWTFMYLVACTYRFSIRLCLMPASARLTLEFTFLLPFSWQKKFYTVQFGSLQSAQVLIAPQAFLCKCFFDVLTESQSAALARISLVADWFSPIDRFFPRIHSSDCLQGTVCSCISLTMMQHCAVWQAAISDFQTVPGLIGTSVRL